jgi:hypothetical protein
MNCPLCKTELVRLPNQERYQDLLEHVLDPNGEPSMKDLYTCPNDSCEMHTMESHWGYTGEWYRTRKGSTVSYMGMNMAPYDSWERQMYTEIYDKTGDRLLFNLYFIRVELKWEKEANMQGDVLRRRPYILICRRTRIGFVWWKMPFSKWAHRIKINRAE